MISRQQRFLFLAALLWSASPAMAEDIDGKIYYRLSTQFRGTDLPLDVFNGGPRNLQTHLDKFQDVSGQYWIFSPNGDGSYRIRNMFTEDKMCLDIFNGGAENNRTQLRDCGNFSGQKWRPRAEGNWLRLTTEFRGENMCLDIINGGPDDNQPELRPCGNFTGQLWFLSATDKRRTTFD
jgi:Ricin-type beta-trefoil lectin domain